MLESSLERRVCEVVKSYGGTAYKWVSPGTPGVPDRICVFPNKLIFVELKRLDGKVSIRQEKEINRLLNYGCEVWVIRSIQDLRARLNEVLNEV